MTRIFPLPATLLLPFLLLGLVACAKPETPALPRLQLDPQRVAVVGLSSGAIMAQQVHFAFSDHIVGAVLLAGPPYGCAEGSLELALSRCMKGESEPPDVARLAGIVRERAADGRLAPLEGLQGDRIFALRGRFDAIVAEPVAKAAFALYGQLPVGASMPSNWDGDGAFAHLWPKPGTGDDCTQTATPFLGRCDRDLAGETMARLFGPPSRAADEARGELGTFGQEPFGPGDEDAFLDAMGYLYRPTQCESPGRCGLLIAFHGCEQNAAAVGEAFVRDSGLNRWADVHDVVVLYPQTRATYMPLNPKACWDWWGYSGPDYDTRKGVQLRAIANMAAALGAPLAD
jgi:poly(3-hydroxybutyrate) depolymerase